MLAFAVTLSTVASRTLPVDVTSDGSAQAGQDYTAKSGRPTFEAGESAKTVEVAVFDDAHYEGREMLTLSNASGGWRTARRRARSSEGRSGRSGQRSMRGGVPGRQGS